MNQTCIEPNLPCNCDAKLPDWQVDEGIITDKDLLPITEFAYGPLEYDLEEAKVSIGSLKCSGLSKGKSILTDPKSAPELLRNDCGLAELVTDNRLKINLRYNSNMRCYVTLKLPERKTLKLTIDDFKVNQILDFGTSSKIFNFFQTEDDYDYFYVFDGPYESRDQLKIFDGDLDDVSYQWSGDTATFYWKTDSSSNYGSMIAIIQF